MTQVLHERARKVRERQLIRAWEYRQRNYSHGVWYRLRRVLVDAAEAWVIDDTDADRLERLGRSSAPVGQELVPPKRLFFVTLKDLELLAPLRRIPVRIGRELLDAPNVALVPHDEAACREQSCAG